MGKFVITTALALVLAGGAYAQDHRGGGVGRGMGGGGMGGGGMSAQMGGGGGPGGGPSMMSRGPSGSSNFSSMSRGPSGQGRTLFNQERGNHDIRGDMRSGQLGRGDRDDMRHGQNFYNHSRDHLSDRDNRHLYNRADRDDFRRHDRDIDHHHGVVSGNFFEHGRHFRFRRFFHGEWVFLTDWDDCTAWAWVHVAPGVWAWRPIDVCIG